jgi:26S proteasome regulatory subunit N2
VRVPPYNRAKFTATASLGVIHAAHISEAMQLLEPYLPPTPSDGGGGPATSGSYAEGGSLYALGLIHGSSAASNADKRRETADYVRTHLRASHANEVLSHGAALAVGLTCMGSADLIVVQELKEVLDTDFAVAGEAAGLAIGMVLVGTGAGNAVNSLPNNDSREELMEVVAELKNYARETQHEKIIRGIAVGLALMNFGQEENADAAIEEMRSDRDPIMRYGAQYATALAYCGTGSNKAIRILLHTAVSDVSDDVRMAAVIGLAFVLFKTPERVPQLVKLLLESFNPHVRYASCMAVGIAMAGTGDPESVALLEPMLEDTTDYVRQGALMGTAMIYMQQSDSANARKIRTFREKLSTLVSEKHQSTLTKMGAILSMGIIDAGGRNCSLQLGSRNGFTKMTSAVGLTLWLQHWHWYPLMHMFSLALTPTLTIGLNKNFKYPKNFEIICHAKPSQFAYPKKLQEKKEKEKKRIETVTLSTTAKEKARLARKKAKLDEKDEATMDVDDDDKVAAAASAEEEPAGSEEAKASSAMDVDKEEDDEAGEATKPKKKREPEPTVFTIKNPSRITLVQSKSCSFDLTQRYRPIRPNEKPFGVIMLTDSTPGAEEDLGAVQPPSLEPEGELAPPEPFEWVPPPPPLLSNLSADEDEKEDDDDDDANTTD